MKSFYEKEEFSLEDIQSLIDIKAQESTYLEFKGAASLGSDDKKKKDISVDVSAFANSDGGIIIYGLLEDADHLAGKLDYVDSKKFSRDWLQQVIDSNITRQLSDVIIHTVAKPKQPTDQIFIVKIGQSSNMPHMAKDGRFYRRDSKGNSAMEEYDVRRLYNQTGRTNLNIETVSGGEASPNMFSAGHPKELLLDLNIDIKNIGNSIEHHYKLEVHIPSRIVYSRAGYPLKVNEFLQWKKEGTSMFSIGNTKPLFQNETNRLVSFPIRIVRDYISSLRSDILIRLYYSSGIKEETIKLSDLFTYNYKPISEASFGR